MPQITLRTWLRLIKILLADDSEFYIPHGEQKYYPELHIEWIWKEHCGVALLRKSAAGLLSGWFVAKFLTKPSRFTCKKKTWPIIMGLGMGLGLASEYCKREFGHALSDKRKRRRRHKRKYLNWSETYAMTLLMSGGTNSIVVVLRIFGFKCLFSLSTTMMTLFQLGCPGVDSDLYNGQRHLRVCTVLNDFIYFNFWAFFLILTPVYAFKTMSYVVDKGVIYIPPYVAAFGMIYFKSSVHAKDWVMKKWMDYKDF